MGNLLENIAHFPRVLAHHHLKSHLRDYFRFSAEQPWQPMTGMGDLWSSAGHWTLVTEDLQNSAERWTWVRVGLQSTAGPWTAVSLGRRWGADRGSWSWAAVSTSTWRSTLSTPSWRSRAWWAPPPARRAPGTARRPATPTTCTSWARTTLTPGWGQGWWCSSSSLVSPVSLTRPKTTPESSRTATAWGPARGRERRIQSWSWTTSSYSKLTDMSDSERDRNHKIYNNWYILGDVSTLHIGLTRCQIS